MNWSVLTSIFTLATFKFMLSALPGAHYEVPYYQTYIASLSGGVFSALVFYFFAELVLKWSKKRADEKKAILMKTGKYVPKKRFTRTNKLIVKIKMRFGKIGICTLAPLFLSVPVGSMVVAKFYGKEKSTTFFLIAGMAINAVVVSGITYGIYG